MSEKPRTVYAVTSGSYSDHHVLALFERREDAAAAVAAGLGATNYDTANDIEEFTLFPAAALPRKVGYWAAYLGLKGDGSPDGRTEVWAQPREGWTGVDGEIPGRRPRVEVHAVPWDRSPDSPVSRYNVSAHAMTQEAAVKAVSDAVAKLRAEILEREALKPKPGQKPVTP